MSAGSWTTKNDHLYETDLNAYATCVLNVYHQVRCRCKSWRVAFVFLPSTHAHVCACTNSWTLLVVDFCHTFFSLILLSFSKIWCWLKILDCTQCISRNIIRQLITVFIRYWIGLGALIVCLAIFLDQIYINFWV